jgi:co-chaperonin GroES (HSP10)
MKTKQVGIPQHDYILARDLRQESVQLSETIGLFLPMASGEGPVDRKIGVAQAVKVGPGPWLYDAGGFVRRPMAVKVGDKFVYKSSAPLVVVDGEPYLLIQDYQVLLVYAEEVVPEPS